MSPATPLREVDTGLFPAFRAMVSITESTYMAPTMKKTPAVSTNRIRNPAAAGPAMPVKFIIAELRLMAFIRFFSGTISDSMACLLGMLKAMSEPLMSPKAKMCQNATVPFMSSTPRITVVTALPA